MDRLQSMRVFCKVASLESFSRAATELNLSNAVTSRLVSDLEDHLRIRLLNRSTRSVHLTEAGREYFVRCENILLQIDETEAAALGIEGTPSGTLRILVGFTEGLYILTKNLPDFHKKYPKIIVDIHLAEQTVDIVDKQFDLAIQPRGFVYSNSVVIRDLMSAKLILCATPECLAQQAAISTPEDLNGRPGITLAGIKLRNDWLLKGPDGEVHVQPACVLVSNNLVPILGAVRAGMGIGLVFENVIRDELANGTLVRVLPEYHALELPYFIVYPSRKLVPSKVRVMIDFLLEIFKNEAADRSNHSWIFNPDRIG